MVNESETLGGSLKDLYAFCAVIEFGTLSAAARERGETKGSISRRLSRLEQRLGVALLARTPRSVSATEEGTAFYLKARDALTLLADASASARAAQDPEPGTQDAAQEFDVCWMNTLECGPADRAGP